MLEINCIDVVIAVRKRVLRRSLCGKRSSVILAPAPLRINFTRDISLIIGQRSQGLYEHSMDY